MTEYIYFVKCPGCEAEHFSFFDEAKEYALGCLGNKPIITQTEVCRNDFGECTDSRDLGTKWSWEDMMTDVSADGPAVSVFNTGDFAEYNPDNDPEFDSLDNSVDFVPTELDSVPDNFRKPIVEGNAVLAATRAPKDSDFIIVSKHADGSYSFLGNNYRMTKQLDNAMTYPGKINAEYDIKYAEDQAEASSINVDKYTYNPFFVTTFGEARKLVADRDAYVKQRDAKAAARSSLNVEVRKLAREMYDQGTPCNSFEEFETFMLSNGYDKPTKYLYYSTYRDELMRYAKMSKSKDTTKAEAFERKSIPEGMTIESLVEEMEENEDTIECKWCNELFDKSECRKEVDLGYLCPRCEAAIKSRGETLTFQESASHDPFDHHDPDYSDEVAADYIAAQADSAMDARFDATVDTLEESVNRETVTLEYDDLEVTLFDKNDREHVRDVSYSFELYKLDIAETILNTFITDEDVTDVQGGLDALGDNTVWEQFLETHFDDLFEKYYDKLLEYYRDYAKEAYEQSHSYSDWEDDDYWNEVDRRYDDWKDSQYESLEKSTYAAISEEPEDVDTYENCLTLCPECGENSFDSKTCICISCGFNTFK